MNRKRAAPDGAPAGPRRVRPAGSPWLRLAVLAPCLVLGGCKVVIVSGPTSAEIGDTVIYELEVSSVNFGFDPVPVVVADVPMGWELQASAYAATLDGMPVTGDGIAFDSTVCDAELGAVRPGFRRWHLRPETDVEGLIAAEIGQATIEFLVTDQPADEYEIFFAFGKTEDCSLPAGVAVNRGPSFLTLVGTFIDDAGGVDGLGGPGEATATSDGRHLYVPGGLDSSVAIFSRDPASGTPSFLGTVVDGAGGVDGLAVPRGLAESPDGQYLYVASLSNPDTGDQGGTALFSRDPATGALTFVERLLEDVEYLAVSPDGRHLYAAAAGITVYTRDEASGELSFVQTEFPGGQLMMSPDGRHLYAALVISQTPVIAAYARDDASGELTFLENRGGGRAAALSPDGRHIYAVSPEDSVVRVLERDEATGALSFAFSSPLDPPFSISTEAVTVSPEGSHVIVGGRSAVAVFQRNASTGELTRFENLYALNLAVTELEGTRALAFGPAGRQLFVTSFLDDALVAVDTAILFHDGFESGSAAAWSAAVP